MRGYSHAVAARLTLRALPRVLPELVGALAPDVVLGPRGPALLLHRFLCSSIVPVVLCCVVGVVGERDRHLLPVLLDGGRGAALPNVQPCKGSREGRNKVLESGIVISKPQAQAQGRISPSAHAWLSND